MARKRDSRTRNWVEEQKQKNWILEGLLKKGEGIQEGFYSGDKPNPNLRTFVEAHIKERPYDPESDAYNIPAFDKPIESTKATAIYNMHIYWSKKPHDAIRQYVRHYTEPGDLILDPMCGSGGTALAALMEGRKAIAIDRSPAATFITKNYCTPVNLEKLEKAFEELKRKVKPHIDWLYETRCDRCGGKATVVYTVYSQIFQCQRCLHKIPLFDCVQAEGRTISGTAKMINACPACYHRGIVEEISTRNERFGAIPVLTSYLCEASCKPARAERRHNDEVVRKREYFEKHDLEKLREIEAKAISYWYPTHRMMHAPDDQECWGVKWRAGTSNFRTVDELFTKRNLWALSTILDACESSALSSQLAFVFQSNILSATTMQQYREAGGGFAKGTYYVPQIFVERQQLGCFSRKFDDIFSAQRQIQNELKGTALCISTDNSTDLSVISSNSIDYIFTDPPYAEKVQYGELNFIWEAWLGFDTHWHSDEIIVNEVRGKTESDWARMMRQAMAECYRVLKPGRWLSLCYHDTSEGTWALIQDIMAEVGFVADKSESALFIDTQQKSFNQLVADKVSKRDLVINFRKPRPGEIGSQINITGDEDPTTFNDKVRMIIREYLSAHPGASKDRVYDEVVSLLVRSRSMEAHNFDERLNQVAEPAGVTGNGSSRWYLRDSELDEADTAEAAKEDQAAEKVRTFMTDYLKNHPGDEGVHYSDVFEHYVYAVKDKPRRALVEWLLDYFFKTNAGTYRLPLSKEEERLKSEGRAKGTIRRIKRYLAFIEQSQGIPEKERQNDSTLGEWIRHCKRTGLYEQGKLLYERGGINLDNLPEEFMVDVEDDYQVCARMLAREGIKPPTSGKRKGKRP